MLPGIHFPGALLCEAHRPKSPFAEKQVFRQAEDRGIFVPGSLKIAVHPRPSGPCKHMPKRRISCLEVEKVFYYQIKPGDTIYKLSTRFNIPAELILSVNPGINPNNLLIGQRILIPTETGTPGNGSQPGNSGGISLRELKLRQDLRKLWEEHVAWTRMAILSTAAGSPDLDPTAARLLRNADDMGAALKPLYGEGNGARFADLIREHLNIALRLVTAAKQGDNQAAREEERRWYANADQIAAFTNSINPNINEEAFRNMLYTHIALTKEQALAILGGDYEKGIALYDQIEDQALDMADAMADGIVRQFPTVFRIR
jgi:LysM repeat protein